MKTMRELGDDQEWGRLEEPLRWCIWDRLEGEAWGQLHRLLWDKLNVQTLPILWDSAGEEITK